MGIRCDNPACLKTVNDRHTPRYGVFSFRSWRCRHNFPDTALERSVQKRLEVAARMGGNDVVA